jgi:DNA-directed RNA polymerase specialized sigma24 family protein
MNIPNGKTEKEVCDIISSICSKLASNFKFGYFTTEDIFQEAFRIGIEAMNKGGYDEGRPLENFLFTSIRNGLINFKRDNFKRTDCPCKLCYGFQSGETRHPDGKHCEKYIKWNNRNVQKQNVLLPVGIECLTEAHDKNPKCNPNQYINLEKKETFDIIDQHLPVEYRANYLRMREGVSVPKNIREEIILKIREILNV